MNRDGRNKFFRNLNLDKKVKQLISEFIEIKTKMLKEVSDEYQNGKIIKPK